MNNCKDCKGCLTNILVRNYKEINKCIIKNNAPKRTCPCQKCLVKTNCNKQCEEFKETTTSIWGYKLSNDYKAVYNATVSYGLKPYYHTIEWEQRR